MGNSALIISLGIGLIIAYVASKVLGLQGNAQGLPLPPGPKGLPVVGNVNDLPKPGVVEAHHWLKHKDLYGSCFAFFTRSDLPLGAAALGERMGRRTVADKGCLVGLL